MPRSSVSLIWKLNMISGEEYSSWGSSLCSFLVSFFLFPLGSKYLPQQPMLKHPQTLFLAQCERPSFTHILNDMQNCSSIYFNIYILNSRRQDKKFCCPFYLPWSVNSCDVNSGDLSITVDWNSLNGSEGKSGRHYRRILRSCTFVVLRRHFEHDQLPTTTE